MAQNAVAVDDEGAAFDAAHLLAIHVFHFHDREQIADGFVGVGAKFEGQRLLGLEVLVRLQAVARNSQYYRVDRDELRMEVAELLRLGGTAWRAVLGVEIDDNDLAGLCG